MTVTKEIDFILNNKLFRIVTSKRTLTHVDKLFMAYTLRRVRITILGHAGFGVNCFTDMDIDDFRFNLVEPTDKKYLFYMVINALLDLRMNEIRFRRRGCGGKLIYDLIYPDRWINIYEFYEAFMSYLTAYKIKKIHPYATATSRSQLRYRHMYYLYGIMLSPEHGGDGKPIKNIKKSISDFVFLLNNTRRIAPGSQPQEFIDLALYARENLGLFPFSLFDILKSECYETELGAEAYQNLLDTSLSVSQYINSRNFDIFYSFYASNILTYGTPANEIAILLEH